MLKAYAIGFSGAVIAILAVAGIWLVAQPKQEPGLLWGGTVYSSKQEFQGYLKDKGLSYKVWLARNPGAAPWEPKPLTTAAADSKAKRAAPQTAAAPASEDPELPLSLTTLGLMAATAGALLLLLRLPRPALPRLSRGSVRLSRLGGFGVERRAARAPLLVPAAQRPGGLGSGLTRPLRATVPVYSARLAGAVRAALRLLREPMRRWDLSAGDVVFWLITVVAAGTFAVFVALLVSA